MVRLYVISVGTLKEEYLRSAVSEYEKRLMAYATVENINIKEEKITDEDDRTKVMSALEAEGDRIISKIPDGAYKIALCVEGVAPDSVKLAEYVKSAQDKSGKIALIIGSSHGLSDKVKKTADLCLSVSNLTFPHQLMRVILLESMYRSLTIIAGKRYHK
ncbi:MAG: 23S rRNA (pseudouridine(1915)-N(3))-methyltransferase RlmH [Eubacteriales bacterium]|nr:23S rRNA (pseudouridine(1915)-N(3))-methyltransferase RlmH [Eubacteriales bacterium]